MSVSLFSIRSHATKDHVLQKSSGPLQLTGQGLSAQEGFPSHRPTPSLLNARRKGKEKAASMAYVKVQYQSSRNTARVPGPRETGC